MNFAVMQLLGQYPGLLQLADLKDLKAKDLRVEHAQRIADAFKVQIPFNDELVGAFVALLRGKNIHAVGDLIQSPESIGELVAFFKGGFKAVSSNSKQIEPSADFLPEANTLFLS